jgi:tryptophanyl-tRNA synthetase
MMKPSIELQAAGECFYFIADYHALTSLDDPQLLEERVRGVALDFLACGLDPARTVFYRQSAIPEVHELAWYLSTVTPMGLLERCHSYKDKIANGISPNHGLFAYPVLMAADILLVNADRVPVGKDQKQHIEVTRDIAQKFNEKFGEVFKIPEPVIREDTATIPGSDGRKMSKSYGNTIELFGGEKVLRKQVMALKTDSTPVEAPKPLEDSVLLALAACLAPVGGLEEMKASMLRGGTGYGDYKKQLFDWMWEMFAPFRARRAELERDSTYVTGVLEEGASKARAAAQVTLDLAREAVGMKGRAVHAGF